MTFLKDSVLRLERRKKVGWQIRMDNGHSALFAL